MRWLARLWPAASTADLPVPELYDFDHIHASAPKDLRDLLGGKGANLAEATSVLELPVPAGFTVPTELCRRYLAEGWPAGLDRALENHLARLEQKAGRRLGDGDNPLLVSVRSGAPVSMPGMLDTVLNLGLNNATVEGLARQSGNPEFAWDSYRRFAEFYVAIVLEAELPGASPGQPPRDRVTQLTSNFPIPDDPMQQLKAAVEAVFRSWQSPRASTYRRREQIPDALGTAVNIQAMVFGNMGTGSSRR